jgi:3',5'-cyclic AMP phosphodiesterase CpdA
MMMRNQLCWNDSDKKGERDRLGRSHRRLADGIGAADGKPTDAFAGRSDCSARRRPERARRALSPNRLKLLRLKITFAAFLMAGLIGSASAHDLSHASVHDTVAQIIKRMQRELPLEQLVALNTQKAEAFLTAEEREALGSAHIRFRVNVPVTVTVLRDMSLGSEPFWLRERGFSTNGLKFQFARRDFDAWEKTFPAGEIGLGIHNLTGSGNHYLVLLRAQRGSDTVKVTDLYPGRLRSVRCNSNVEPYVDNPLVLTNVPAALEGQWLIQTSTDSEEDARLVNVFSKTQYPSTNRPEHVVLTWSDNPRTTQTIQWRTSSQIKRGFIRYQEKPAAGLHASLIPSSGAGLTLTSEAPIKRAKTEKLSTPKLLNDPLIHRHTVVLKGLKPATAYVYSVGDGSRDGWTEPAEFITAPSDVVPFSFIYMGDAQNGLDRWGVLLRNAFHARPDAAFYLMAGDLVNRGAERWDWDSFFENAKGVFDRRTLVPVLGNHEYQGGEPVLYLAQLALLRNGPKTIGPERAYAFEYSNAKFIILDSNLGPAKQSAWLEKELANTKAVWKFVSYHHPAYSSGGNRDNAELRDTWTPLFDRYHVDLALQGHDHAYLRTYPMRGQQRVASTKEGTVYIISVSGTKYYEQQPHDYTEVGLTKLSTYQVLDIQIDGNRLVYRAHDVDGKVRDEFVIQK